MEKSKGAPASGEALLRFKEASFGYGLMHPILEEADFSVRRGMKVTLMGQNGAGKSTLFKLITGDFKPEHGKVQIVRGVTIAMAHQVIPPAMREKTLREFFEA